MVDYVQPLLCSLCIQISKTFLIFLSALHLISTCNDDIMAMKNGYNSVVGERGVKVSGGQRHSSSMTKSQKVQAGRWNKTSALLANHQKKI